jgi:hypothetical protein
VSKTAEAGVPTPKLSPQSDTPVIEIRKRSAVALVALTGQMCSECPWEASSDRYGRN